MVTKEEFKLALDEFGKTLSDEEVEKANKLSARLAVVIFDMWNAEQKKEEKMKESKAVVSTEIVRQPYSIY